MDVQALGWKDRAEVLIPELLAGEEAFPTPRDMLWELLVAVRKAFADGEVDFVRRGFDYASICLHSAEPEEFNPAAIGFFCKLAGDEKGLPLEAFASFLAPADFEQLSGLFEFHLGTETTARLRWLMTGAGRQ